MDVIRPFTQSQKYIRHGPVSCGIFCIYNVPMWQKAPAFVILLYIISIRARTFPPCFHIIKETGILSYDEGFAEGRDEGYSAGRDEGYFEGKHLMTDIIIRIRSGNPVEQLLREGFDAADVQKACNALKIAYGA